MTDTTTATEPKKVSERFKKLLEKERSSMPRSPRLRATLLNSRRA